MSIRGWRGMLVAAVVGAGMWVGIWAAVSCSVSDDSETGSVRVELDCPTEDSCSADYRDGAWHIERITP